MLPSFLPLSDGKEHVSRMKIESSFLLTAPNSGGLLVIEFVALMVRGSFEMKERIVEIKRSMLVEEPWVTVKNGVRVVRPAVISSISLLPHGHKVESGPATDLDSESLFRVVDESGPCYEFIATACLDDSGIALNINNDSELRFLR